MKDDKMKKTSAGDKVRKRQTDKRELNEKNEGMNGGYISKAENTRKTDSVKENEKHVKVKVKD